jgi:hypothetical protein
MSTNKKVKLDYILYAIIIGLLIVLIIGTITGLANKRNSEPEVLLQQGKAVNLSKPANTDIVSYYEIGNIRIVTPSEEPENEQEGCVLVVNPWLSYAEGDTVFY